MSKQMNTRVTETLRVQTVCRLLYTVGKKTLYLAWTSILKTTFFGLFLIKLNLGRMHNNKCNI